MLLKDKIVVVTGGAGLLGEAFCKAIIENDGIAIIAENNIDRGFEVSLNLNALYGQNKSHAVALDITSKDSINEAIDYLFNKYGHIDALVNSAYPRNKNYGRKFEDVEYSDFSENISLNLGGYFLTSQQFALYFEKQSFGNIINISSIYGVIAPRFEIYNETSMTMPIEYAAIKSALLHLTKYMAKYFKGKNIRFNAISLGGIIDKQPESFVTNYKNFTLNKGMLDNSDINGTLVYLLSDMSKFVNGQNIIVDDGFTL